VRAWRSNGRSLGLGHFLYRWRASATWGSLFPHVLCSQRQLAGSPWTPVVSDTWDRVAGPRQRDGITATFLSGYRSWDVRIRMYSTCMPYGHGGRRCTRLIIAESVRTHSFFFSFEGREYSLHPSFALSWKEVDAVASLAHP
jgi:hypothetical protein